jgi:hypothetical protein
LRHNRKRKQQMNRNQSESNAHKTIVPGVPPYPWHRL